jgi:membrane protein YdbS with pleckstrin-like domain
MTNIDPDQVTPPAPAAAAVPGAVPEPANTAHRPPDDAEEVYYEGSPLVRGAIGKGLLWVMMGLIIIGLMVAGIVLDWKWPWWVNLAATVVGVAMFFVPVVLTKTVRYRVTNYRIDFERGLLSKDIDTLELWHVEDIRFHQSLVDRMLGVGDVTIISHDETMPRLVLASVPNPRHLYEQLKQRVIAVKRQRGVMKMDPG